MIERDIRDDGAVGVDDVDGIQPTAEPDLENRDIDIGRVEDGERGQRAVFEVRQARIAARRLDTLEASDQLLVSRETIVDANAFVVNVQVRRRVGADAKACAHKKCHEVSDRGSLAIRAAHGQHARRARTTHALVNGIDAVEPEFDFFRGE